VPNTVRRVIDLKMLVFDANGALIATRCTTGSGTRAE